MSYFPYGQERVVTGDGTDRFATYFRDPNGIDYAQQRYYGSMYGRFLTPDQSGLNEALEEPASWNQYSYVHGDPVNSNDPTGQQASIEVHPFPPGTRPPIPNPVPRIGSPGGPVVPRGLGRGAAPPTASSALAHYDAQSKLMLKLGPLGGISAQCLRMIGGKSYVNDARLALMQTAMKIRFYDGRVEGHLYMDLAGARNYHISFAQYHASRPSVFATVLSNRSGNPSDRVVLWHDYFGDTARGRPNPITMQMETLWHELVHVHTGKGDSELVDKFRIPRSATGYASDSSLLQRWLDDECPKY